jgi:membrane associated rhomboid family serine protease
VVIPVRDQLPTRTVPFVNYLIIAANVGVFLLERLAIANGVAPERLLLEFGFVPRRVFIDPTWSIETVFTSMFMHDPLSIMHIGGNMLYLWIFGDNVEDALGHGRYLLFYLLGGVAAATLQGLAGPMSLVPMVGASGAISAVLAAYALLYPRSPISVLVFFFFIVQFPAWLVISLFFLVNLWSALGYTTQGGVAFLAHVGGFIAGLVLLRVFMAGRVRRDEYARWERWVHRRDRGSY